MLMSESKFDELDGLVVNKQQYEEGKRNLVTSLKPGNTPLTLRHRVLRPGTGDPTFAADMSVYITDVHQSGDGKRWVTITADNQAGHDDDYATRTYEFKDGLLGTHVNDPEHYTRMPHELLTGSLEIGYFPKQEREFDEGLERLLGSAARAATGIVDK